ncbi:hypothetical protein [Zhihengliuella flava]|uniref:Uncharacterized protein n=1 Tax=Zhihengliuella flava TaxID=1285193 RepID=A0A931D8S4_9MICC|nr:hypothetical protein [Zhihengliuella flava]MBG6084474.1 hypothetical protein [Zhihengliuella flava]
MASRVSHSNVNEVETLVADTFVASMSLPGERTSESVNKSTVPLEVLESSDDPLVSTEYGESIISSYATAAGNQTLIEIPSASAARSYEFDLELPDGASASLDSDGSVIIVDAADREVGRYFAPWAFDAHGDEVETWFEVVGDKLIQHVKFAENSAFPIVADPSSAWGWTVCVATVTAEVAGNAFVAAKLYKVIQRFGSIRRTMQIMVRAWNSSTNTAGKWAAVRNAVGGTAAEIIGIDAVKNACFD